MNFLKLTTEFGLELFIRPHTVDRVGVGMEGDSFIVTNLGEKLHVKEDAVDILDFISNTEKSMMSSNDNSELLSSIHQEVEGLRGLIRRNI